MRARRKSSARKTRSGSIRQSVTIPGELAIEVRRVAKERHLTMSRALVTLAECGVRVETAAKQNLKSAYKRFLRERDKPRKETAGRDLIRTIFGEDAIAEDPIL